MFTKKHLLFIYYALKLDIYRKQNLLYAQLTKHQWNNPESALGYKHLEMSSPQAFSQFNSIFQPTSLLNDHEKGQIQNVVTSYMNSCCIQIKETWLDENIPNTAIKQTGMHRQIQGLQ